MYHLPFGVGFDIIISAFIYWTRREIKTIWPKLSLAISRVKSLLWVGCNISQAHSLQGGCCCGGFAWGLCRLLCRLFLSRVPTTPAQAKSSYPYSYPEPFEVVIFSKGTLIQVPLHHNKPIPYRLNLPLWMYQDSRRSSESKEPDSRLLFQITETYIPLLIRSILSLEKRRSTSDTFLIAFISGERNSHKWKKKRILQSWKRVHWQSRRWSSSFWSRLACLGHSF